MTIALDLLAARAEHLLTRLEAILPHALAAPDWNAAIAFRYRKRAASGWLQPVRQVSTIALSDLQEVDGQKAKLVRNTAQFVAGDRKSTRLNSSHLRLSRMPSSA